MCRWLATVVTGKLTVLLKEHNNRCTVPLGPVNIVDILCSTPQSISEWMTMTRNRTDKPQLLALFQSYITRIAMNYCYCNQGFPRPTITDTNFLHCWNIRLYICIYIGKILTVVIITYICIDLTFHICMRDHVTSEY